MTSKDKREGWLKDLKIGDKVVADHSYNGFRIGKIVKITPTGKLDVDFGGVEPKRFNERGYYSSYRGYSSTHLKQYTVRHQAIIENKELLYKGRDLIENIFKNSNGLIMVENKIAELDTHALRSCINHLELICKKVQ